MRNLTKLTVAILLLITTLLVTAPRALAESKAAGSSATLAVNYSLNQKDDRSIALRKYLTQRNSPLADYSDVFVANADKYNLDWRLVAAISGVESSFGEAIPSNSYNGWGWGIYGDHVLRFNSWNEAIETISKGLRENYLRENVDSDPYTIGPTYAASPTWAERVSFFMQQIGEFKLDNEKEALSLSI